MYAQLGSIKFQGLKGFNKFTRTNETVYAEISLIGGKPNLQRTGEKLQEIEIGIMFHADFCNPESEIEQLNTARSTAEILPLVLGNGRVVGDFVIVSVSENTRKTDQLGNVIYADVDISIREFPAVDKIAQAAAQAVENAFASDLNKVVPSKLAAIEPSPGLLSAKLGTTISINADTINKSVDTAVFSEAKRPSMFAKIADLSQRTNEAALELSNRMRSLQSQVNNATDIIRDAEDMARFASDMATAVATNDINKVVSANSTLQQSANLLYSTNATLVTLVAARKI